MTWLPGRTIIPQNSQNFYGPKPQDPSDFLWLMTEEPHRSRRMAIMKAHPEVSFDHLFLFSSCVSSLLDCSEVQNNNAWPGSEIYFVSSLDGPCESFDLLARTWP